MSVEKTPPSKSKGLSEQLLDTIYDKFIPPEKQVPKEKRLAVLTQEQKDELQAIEDKAITNFAGQLDELESALGMLRMGHHVGWKVLYLIHSKKTIRKYEDILDIKIREIFADKGPSAGRSLGLVIAEKYSNFWKVVSGEIKTDLNSEERRKLI